MVTNFVALWKLHSFHKLKIGVTMIIKGFKLSQNMVTLTEEPVY